MTTLHHEPLAASDDLSLLLAEWQGYGLDAAPAAGARALAGLFPPGALVETPAPESETLAVESGVIGLSSIAQRAHLTLSTIQARRPARLFTVGATCGVELAPVAYLNDHYRGDLAVVWLDAHGDMNTPESSPSARFHGMVLRTLMGAGPGALVRLVPRRLAPEQVVLAGTRDLDRDEATFISDSAVSLLSPADLRVPDRVAGRIRAGGFRRIYLHLDLDVLDPAEFPDTLVHSPGGLSMDELVETVRGLAADFEVVGFSIVEFRPTSADALTRVRRLLDRCGLSIGALSAP
jgi:arginase